ncbi:hypothetical protein [Streptomyces sp. NPDC017991]|uniref:hypothetical protein n=1 Tax=Streptomyces sp. NPDC017991 TaxID=3365026 RepID=UPI00379B1678
MSNISRRKVLGVGVAATAAGLAGCGRIIPARDAGRNSKETQPRPSPKLIGDGSTSFTGKQPHQPHAPEPLRPGQAPPQFIVFSWDGAGDVGDGTFTRFLDLAEEHDASMTFFLSGLYLLPESKKMLYNPPNNPKGASDIGYLTDAHIRTTLKNIRRAWLEGHEIGTHFNGHFCAGSGSVRNWTADQWRSEIDQAKSFVKEWRTNTGWNDLPPLPFDYEKELVGGRTPCLLGQGNLLPTAREAGWRYDASSSGGTQIWPSRRQGIWDLPLQQIPFPGHSFEVLSMDYNLMANQSVNATQGPRYNYPNWKAQSIQAYTQGFQRAYETNRAPFFVGNHFEHWNDGIYMDAVEEVVRYISAEKEKGKDVRMVSFRQFVDWIDAQEPAKLAKLRTLGVGQAPSEGWKAFLA